MEQIHKRLFGWASILEPQALRQTEAASLMPFIWPHMALMPDAHLGKGATVGSVIPTLGAIMPAAVGVDIGCGMIAHRTSLVAGQLEDPQVRAALRERIEAYVPLSAGNYKPGLIQGSMGAASYVVTGLGNRLSLNSSPHGAGRNYSRGAAKREFTFADLEARMAKRGTEWRHTDVFLDEHPLAYKDIDVVMADAADLVKIEHTLHQVVNVKGD